MTVFLTLLSVLIALIIFAGAFYLAKYVVSLIARTVLLETNYKFAEEHILKQEDAISELQNTIDQMSHNIELSGKKTVVPRTWIPQDMLNSNNRERD